jgi:hypothetical protein
MKTTLSFPDDLMTEVKHEAVRQHRKLNELVPELVRLGLAAQRQAPAGSHCRETADAWLTGWQAAGARIAARKQPAGSLVATLEADRASRG